MAHRISHASGRDEIAYAGVTPWHGLGVKVDGLQTAAAMLTAAGLDWRVEMRDLFRAVPGVEVPGYSYQGVDGYQAIVRADTDVLLGVVSSRYLPIQNAQAGDMMDALVTEGGAHVEVAGALDEGHRCWMLAHIPADFEVVKADVVRPYMLLAWGHDGKHGLAGKLTPIRAVCDNTLQAAGFGDGVRWSLSADVYVRHSKNATVRIEEARKALGLMRQQVESTREAYQALARPIEGQQAPLYFQTVFQVPAPPAATAPPEESESYADKLARWEAHQAKLLELYASAEPAGVRGTAWAAYNAVTEWTDHVYPVLQSGEVSAVRTQSVLFGSYAETKRRAFTEALALVGS